MITEHRDICEGIPINQDQVGPLARLESAQTIQHPERICLIYHGNKLYSLMSQGSTEGEYEYWLSMLNYCHLTFTLGLFQPDQLG